MKVMKFKILPLVVFAGLVFGYQSADAASVTAVQTYGIEGSPSFREELTNTLITATVQFDNDALAGVGTEYIPLNSVNLEFSNRGLPGLVPGLNFSSVVNPVVAHLFQAVYVDNVYTKFGWLDDGGGLFRAGFSPEGPGINQIAFTLGGAYGAGQLSFLITNGPRYNFSGLAPATVTVGPAPIPVPAALPLFLSALAGMGFFGWLRKRIAAA